MTPTIKLRAISPLLFGGVQRVRGGILFADLATARELIASGHAKLDNVADLVLLTDEPDRRNPPAPAWVDRAMSYPGLNSRVLIRVRELCTLADGRQIGPYGLFGSLHAVHREDALRLLEAGAAKLPASIGLRRHALREYCERHDV